MTVAAQRRALSAGLTTRAYAEGHRKLSSALLAEERDPGPAAHTARAKDPRPLPRARVFVLLGHVFGATGWRARHTRREIPGLNDTLPYGYYRAAGEGWSIGPPKMLRRASHPVRQACTDTCHRL